MLARNPNHAELCTELLGEQGHQLSSADRQNLWLGSLLKLSWDTLLPRCSCKVLLVRQGEVCT